MKKYRKAEYVQRRVSSSNVQVLFVFEVILRSIQILEVVFPPVFHHGLSSILVSLPRFRDQQDQIWIIETETENI